MRVRLILLGGLAGALFFLAQVPAGFALKPLAEQGRLQADAVSGSLWAGRALRVRVAGWDLSDVEWRLRLLPLLLARAGVDLRFSLPGGGGEASLSCGLSGACEASDLRAALPLAGLAARNPQLAALDPSGLLDVDLSNLAVAGERLTELAGTLAVRDLQLGPPFDLALGTLEARFTRDGEDFIGALGDRGGPLELGGSLTLTAGGEFRLDARLKPRESASQTLRQGLQALGRPDPQGRYTLRYNGRL